MLCELRQRVDDLLRAVSGDEEAFNRFAEAEKTRRLPAPRPHLPGRDRADPHRPIGEPSAFRQRVLCRPRPEALARSPSRRISTSRIADGFSMRRLIYAVLPLATVALAGGGTLAYQSARHTATVRRRPLSRMQQRPHRGCPWSPRPSSRAACRSTCAASAMCRRTTR